MTRYNAVSDFYKKKFGCKVYKLSLDAGCTCPTRDGTLGTGGCIFCSASGSGDFASPRSLSITAQVEKAKLLVKSKNKDGRYIAYFQNFTSTYGDPDRLEKEYREALTCSGIAGIAIATRPDCLDEEMLGRIARLCDRTFVSVELGLQTVKPETVRYIRRGYETAVYDDAVRRIHKACPDIHVVTHVIFGLPGESADDMTGTVRHTADAGTDGIKIAVLHVLRGTDLAADYEKGLFKCMEMKAYFSVVAHAVNELPPQIVIHRLTGDGPKRLLIAPLWTAQKHSVHNSLERYFEEHDVMQGRAYKGPRS